MSGLDGKSPADLLRVRPGQLGVAAGNAAVQDNHCLRAAFGVDVRNMAAYPEGHRTNNPRRREDREAHPDIYRCHHRDC